MKISELIKLLQDFPSDMDVMVDGYEGGLADPELPRQVEIKRNVNKESYYGPHETILKGYDPSTNDFVCFISR